MFVEVRITFGCHASGAATHLCFEKGFLTELSNCAVIFSRINLRLGRMLFKMWDARGNIPPRRGNTLSSGSKQFKSFPRSLKLITHLRSLFLKHICAVRPLSDTFRPTNTPQRQRPDELSPTLSDQLSNYEMTLSNLFRDLQAVCCAPDP